MPGRSVLYFAPDFCMMPDRRALAENLTAIVEGRSTGPHVFLPLLHAVAAHVKAEPIRPFLTDATRLANGLMALYQSAGTDCVFVTCAALIEAEALGARLDWSSYPPRLIACDLPPSEVGLARLKQAMKCARVTAAASACVRLNSTLPSQTAVGVGLTGPRRLAAELFSQRAELVTTAPDTPTSEELDCSGKITLAFARLFLEAGASVIVLLERMTDLDFEPERIADWADTVTPIINVAAFHRIPIVLLLKTGAHCTANADVTEISGKCVVAIDGQLDTRDHLPKSASPIDLYAEPSDVLLKTSRVIVTRDEVPLTADVARLSGWTKRWRTAINSRSLGD